MIPQWSQPYVNRYFSLRIRYRRHTYLYDTQILMANSFNLSRGLSKAIAYTLDIECNWFSCTCLVQVTVNKPNQAHLGLCESDVTSKLFCGNHPSKWAHPTIHLSPPIYSDQHSARWAHQKHTADICAYYTSWTVHLSHTQTKQTRI